MVRHARIAAMLVVLATLMLLHGCSGRSEEQLEVVLQDDFIVNMHGSTKSYIKAKVVLVTNDKNSKKLLEKRTNQIRDIVVGILAAEIPLEDQSTTVKMRDYHKREISKTINEGIPSKPVTDVYFTDYVRQ